MKKFLLSQLLVIAAGTAFAWKTVFEDFNRFFSAGGDFFQFSGCRFPNPLATPCFYGALAFLIALVWAAGLRQSQSLASQKKLSYLLLAGSIFAWSVNAWEFYKFFKPHADLYVGCNGLPATSPVFTPCFAGASFYLISLLLSLWIIKIMKKDTHPNA